MGEKPANLRLSQLFKLFANGWEERNEPSLTHWADLILATILANQSMSEVVKDATQQVYRKLSDGAKSHLRQRLAVLSQIISLRNVRNINFRNWPTDIVIQIKGHVSRIRASDSLAISNEGKLVTASNDFKLYDETNPQREREVNLLMSETDYSPAVQLGGVNKEGVTVLLSRLSYTTHNVEYRAYFPGQAESKALTWLEEVLSSAAEGWYLFPLASKPYNRSGMARLYIRGEMLSEKAEARNLSVSDELDKSLRFGQGIDSYPTGQIYDLASGQLLFTYILADNMAYIDDFGQYVAIITNMQGEGMVVELYQVDRAGDKRLFRILIPLYTVTECTIDPYHRLIYIHDLYHLVIDKPGEEREDINVLLIVDFKGQIRNRYIYTGVMRFHPTAKYLLSYERKKYDVYKNQANLVKEIERFRIQLADLLADLQYGTPGYKVGILKAKLSMKETKKYQTPLQLPDYQVWIDLPLSGFDARGLKSSVEQLNRVLIRNVNEEFQVEGLVKELDYDLHPFVRRVDTVNSPSADYFMLAGSEKSGNILPITQGVLYTDNDATIIKDILEVPPGSI